MVNMLALYDNILLSEKDKCHPNLRDLDLSQYSDFNMYK